jgi:hypothetical protein
MATELVTAREMAELVRPVRALLKQNKKTEAIKLVNQRMGYGLKESLEFIRHVQLWPGARAIKVAELWTNASVGETIADTPDDKAEPAGTSNGCPPKTPSDTGISLADSYAQYMKTHTYSDWEQLVEKCLAAKSTERPCVANGPEILNGRKNHGKQ